MKFQGSQNYVATQDLMLAVNAAITLQRPLLIKGEPGTGKTMLAEEVAQALDMPLLQWHIKSTTKAQQGLYEYDAVSRLRDSQLNDEGSAERVRSVFATTPWGWVTFTSPSTVRNLVEALGESLWNEGKPTLDVASIGPTTSAELRKFGAEPAVEAGSPGAANLVDSIAATVVSRRRGSS